MPLKRADGGAQWVLRVTVHGRRREMGLGSLSNISLATARDLADRWRSVTAEGRDPIKERDRDRLDAVGLERAGIEREAATTPAE